MKITGTIAKHPSPPQQRGVAALVVILILLFSISGITLYAANTGVLEQKISTNDYRSKQLSEAADAGLQYAMAWLSANAVSWITDPNDANFQIDNNNLTTTLTNGFTADIQLRRATASAEHVTITATATETGGAPVTAVAQTVVLQRKVVVSGPEAPLVINGCVSSVNGNPDIENTSSTYEVVSSQSSACIEQGHFGGSTGFDVQGNGFTGTAWDRTFGISQAEMQALASVAGSNVYWITQSTPWHTDLGSIGNPVIAVFTNCAKVNGGTTIVGIAYYFGACETNGWGAGTILGSVVIDGDMTHMNANTLLQYDSSYVNGLENNTIGLKARVPGTWIDQ